MRRRGVSISAFFDKANKKVKKTKSAHTDENLVPPLPRASPPSFSKEAESESVEIKPEKREKLTRTYSYRTNQGGLIVREKNILGEGHFGKVQECAFNKTEEKKVSEVLIKGRSSSFSMQKLMKIPGKHYFLPSSLGKSLLEAMKNNNLVIKSYHKKEDREIYNVIKLNQAEIKIEKQKRKKETNPIELVNLQMIVYVPEHGQYSAIGSLAKYGSLKSFLEKLSRKDKSLSDDILDAFEADPADFLFKLASRMKDCIDYFQSKLKHFHLDVSARNFLMFSFKKDDFIRDANGKAIGIKPDRMPIKLSDFGNAIGFENENAIVTVPDGFQFAACWADILALKDRKVSLISDWYAFRSTLISMISLLIGDAVENRLLFFNGLPSVREEVISKTSENADNQNFKHMATFIKNANRCLLEHRAKVLSLPEVTAAQKEIKKYKLKLSEGLLVFLSAYEKYILSMAHTERAGYIPADIKKIDNYLFSLVDINAEKAKVAKKLHEIDSKIQLEFASSGKISDGTVNNYEEAEELIDKRIQQQVTSYLDKENKINQEGGSQASSTDAMPHPTS